jgi:uncharacterized protein (DUF1684 family)
MDQADYIQELEAWRQKLDQSLRAENGWLALAGLFWLNPGSNSFGSAPSKDIPLTGKNLPAQIGSFVLKDGNVKLSLNEPGSLQVNEQSAEPMTLKADLSGEPDILTFGPLTLMVIERGDRLGIRLWDNERPERALFEGRSWFPIRPEYRIETQLQRHNPPVELQIVSTSGVIQPATGVGRLTFQLHGQVCTLEALEGGDDSVSLIFKDASAEDETYPSGRFLTAPLSEEDDVILDFNRAYNPPCAFSVYTTCPLPPPENILAVRVEAGERFLGHAQVGEG